MSLLEGCKSVIIDEFNGVKPLVDVADISPGDAIIATNCKFSPGNFTCREGFTPAWVQSPAFTASCPYYYAYGDPTTASAHYLAWLDITNARITARNLGTSISYQIKTGISGSATYASFASNGKRLYASYTYLSGGAVLLSGGLVWDGNTSHTMDDTFQRPMKTTEVTLALTEPLAGDCTAGLHNVGVLFQTRSGYWTKPGPCNSSVVLQAQTITSSGAKNVRATLTPASTWPTWIAAVQLIYTRTLNNFQYYVVPGTITAVTAGSATVYTIDISVSDLQIGAIGSQGAGTLADNYFDLLSMDGSNAPPFNVKFQISWGNRLVWFGNYGGVDCFFPSDPENDEWISANEHLKSLPNGLPIGAAFVLRGVLYVVSSAGGVFAYTDNGGRPVNFAPAQIIDSRLSCQSNNLVTVSASGGYAFVMADQGLFVYSGSTFPQIPMSYFQSPDITTYGLNISIKDFSRDQIVVVQGKNAAGTAFLYTWNYQDGMTPKKVRAAVWTFAAWGGSFPHIETVRNPSTSQWELWISSVNAGGFLRQKSVAAGDAALYTDYTDTTTTNGTFGINQQYQTSILPPNEDGVMLNHLAGRLRALQCQASVAVLSISAAAAAVITFTNPHGLTVGTPLTVTLSGVTGAGWTTINGTWTPTVLSTTSFSVPVNSSAFIGSAGGTIICAFSSLLSLAVGSLDFIQGTQGVGITPNASPMALSLVPGKRYLFYYDLVNEHATYYFSNGGYAGNAFTISEVAHFYNLMAMER